MESKKTRGRQKIEIKKIENEEDRLVTFSKRRSGVFKKSNELATLCGAEVGVVVFSTSGKPFSYGHPSIESIAQRFLSLQSSHQENGDVKITGSSKQARYVEMLQRHNELEGKLKAEKVREEVLKQKERARASEEQEGLSWWQHPVQELDLEDLKQMLASFQRLHTTLSHHLTATGNKVNNNVASS
ncbi:hypothetical protein M0R45_030036 [Rubus argutus]|uniref:MADS-box domain-containing protein n=1 Tax=Rubus argutus TaxID=59490 RepID=A0AAW1WC12_RUBAR